MTIEVLFILVQPYRFCIKEHEIITRGFRGGLGLEFGELKNFNFGHALESRYGLDFQI